MTTRQQIRDAVKALIEALPGNAGLVHTYQRQTIETNSHAIIVQMDEGRLTHYVGMNETAATLVVQVLSPAVTGIDDALDALADAIEAAIGADITLGGLVTSCSLSAWTYAREQDEPMTALELAYTVTY